MILFFIFILLFLVISWSYLIYPLILYLLNQNISPHKPLEILESYPDLSLVVCCFNEEKLIAGKVRDIQGLDYSQGKLKVYFVDGGSKDKTLQILKETTVDLEQVKIVESTSDDESHK